jgi:hypothetical protein
VKWEEAVASVGGDDERRMAEAGAGTEADAQ